MTATAQTTTPVRSPRSRRTPGVLRGHPLNYPAGVSSRYQSTLEGAVRRMTREVETEIMRMYGTPAFTEFFAMDASVSSQARIVTNALMRKFSDLFSRIAKSAAEDMVRGVNAASNSAVRSSLFELSRNFVLDPDALFTSEMKEVMSAAVAENVSLIKSVGSRYLDQVQGAVMRSITTGNGLADLVPFLEKQHGITVRRARFIALDQSRKVFSSLNLIRMRKAGVKKFEWLHSAGSQHPRKQHVAWSGRIFSLDDLPVSVDTGQRTFPGFEPECKCRACPIVDFSDD